MITLEQEINRSISTKDACKVIDYAIQACKDGGFLCSFVFERALFVFLSIMLFEDRKKDITALIGDEYDICAAWDYLIEKGIAKKIIVDYPDDLKFISENADQWLKEAQQFELSARGVVDSISTLSGNIVEEAIKGLQSATNTNLEEIKNFNEHWNIAPVLEENESEAK